MSRKILTPEEQLDALMSERARVYDELGHITDPEMRRLYINRIAWTEHWMTEDPAIRKAFISRYISSMHDWQENWQ